MMTYYSTCHKLETQENPNDCTRSTIMKALHYRFSHVSVNLNKCFREFSDYVISVAEINTCKSDTGHWGSYGDHIRGVEQQPKAPLLSVRQSFLSTQSTQAGHQWSSPCDCPLCAKCVSAYHYCHYSEVSSGRDVLCRNKETGPLGVMPS